MSTPVIIIITPHPKSDADQAKTAPAPVVYSVGGHLSPSEQAAILRDAADLLEISS